MTTVGVIRKSLRASIRPAIGVWDIEPAKELVRRARQSDVEVGPVALQDLFIHLTEPTEPAGPGAGEAS